MRLEPKRKLKSRVLPMSGEPPPSVVAALEWTVHRVLERLAVELADLGLSQGELNALARLEPQRGAPWPSSRRRPGSGPPGGSQVVCSGVTARRSPVTIESDLELPSCSRPGRVLAGAMARTYADRPERAWRAGTTLVSIGFRHAARRWARLRVRSISLCRRRCTASDPCRRLPS